MAEDLTDTVFFVRKVDVYPDGAEYFVVEGAINARTRVYAKSLLDKEEDINTLFSNIEIGEVYGYAFNEAHWLCLAPHKGFGERNWLWGM